MRRKFFIVFFFVLSILPFLVRTSLTFLSDPPPWPDEAIYVDIVRTLNETGKMATNIYGPTYPGMTKAATFYPPVYFHILAGWTKLFGYSIESVRLLSTVAMTIVFVLLYMFFLKASHRPWIAAIGILILSTELWFTRVAKIARMESLVFLFGTLAIFLSRHSGLLFRHSGLDPESRYTKIRQWLTSIFAALAVLTHPMGALIHILLGLQVIFFSRRASLRSTIYDLFLLTFPSILGVTLWLISMLPVWNIFTTQWSIQYLRKALQEPFMVFLFNTNPASQLTAIITGLTCVAGLANPLSRKAALLLVCAILWALWGREMWYIAYITPFLAYTVVLLLKNKDSRFIGLLVTVAIIFSNLRSLPDFPNLPYSPDRYSRYSTAIAAVLPKDARVLVSSIPDPSFLLVNHLTTRPFEFIHDHVTTPAIYQAHLDTIDYVVINLIQDPILPSYIRENIESQQIINEAGYQAAVIKLKPKEERHRIQY